MLLSVVVGVGGTEIFGVLECSLSIAFIQIGNDLGVEVLNFFFLFGLVLNSIVKKNKFSKMFELSFLTIILKLDFN